jgi:hypothetical protein
MDMTQLVARFKVFANAAVTVLTLVMAVLLALSEQIGDILPGSTGEAIATWCVRIVAWIVGTIAIIRRVSPADKSERGLLPAEPPA